MVSMVTSAVEDGLCAAGPTGSASEAPARADDWQVRPDEFVAALQALRLPSNSESLDDLRQSSGLNGLIATLAAALCSTLRLNDRRRHASMALVMKAIALLYGGPGLLDLPIALLYVVASEVKVHVQRRWLYADFLRTAMVRLGSRASNIAAAKL